MTTAMMMRGMWLAAGVGLFACGGQRTADGGQGTANGGQGTANGGRRVDSAGGSAARRQEPGVSGKLPANKLGRIPVLEYHVVGDSTRGEFIISRGKFEHDLQLLYDRGYRPITI